MNKAMPPWELLHAFLHIAEEGSYSAAARKLGTTQPTLSRQIRALETQYGDNLFIRHVHGVTLTSEGEELLSAAKAMNLEILRLFDKRENSIAGTVRVTASEVMSHYVLPPFFAQMRQFAPEIQLVLVASDSLENLQFREVDIAVRLAPSHQLDVISKQIGEIGFGVYASKAYLARHGHPVKPEDLLDFDLVGFDQQDLILREMRKAGLNVLPTHFATRTDSQSSYWQLLKAGCGIGFGQRNIGDADPTLERLLPDLVLPNFTVWLASSEALRYSKRQRFVWDKLEEFLRTITS